jgi:hypothetical protein
MVGAMCFMSLEGGDVPTQPSDAPRCPHNGRASSQLLANNFSPCCTHYSVTCCDLSRRTCSQAFSFSGLLSRNGSALPERCAALLSLLSCARCSPYAGYFTDESPRPISMRPNLTVCPEFCDEAWTVCGGVQGPSTGGPASAREFCTQGLGLRLASHADEPCFYSGVAEGDRGRWPLVSIH